MNGSPWMPQLWQRPTVAAGMQSKLPGTTKHNHLLVKKAKPVFYTETQTTLQLSTMLRKAMSCVWDIMRAKKDESVRSLVKTHALYQSC